MNINESKVAGIVEGLSLLVKNKKSRENETIDYCLWSVVIYTWHSFSNTILKETQLVIL